MARMQHGRHPQERGQPQCKYYDSVKHNYPADSTCLTSGQRRRRRSNAKPTQDQYMVFVVFLSNKDSKSRARILVQVTIYRRLRIGRDGHLAQSDAYDIS